MFTIEDEHGRVVGHASTKEAAHRATRRRHVNWRVGGGHAYRVGNRAAATSSVTGARGISLDVTAQIDALVEKYLLMLGAESLPRPHVEIRSNIASDWLGQDHWTSKDPKTTTLRLQRSILGDPRTLERVIAHEVIHHVEFATMTDREIDLIKIGIRPQAHGARFLDMAEKVNAVMGAGFVTVTSDKEYVLVKNVRPFNLLIVSVYYQRELRLGWMWAARISADASATIDRKVAEGARMVQVTDDKWLSGAKIKKYGGISIPRTPEDAEELRRLFVAAE